MYFKAGNWFETGLACQNKRHLRREAIDKKRSKSSKMYFLKQNVNENVHVT